MEIYLMRHGLTESNIRKIYAGRSDEGLVGMKKGLWDMDYGVGIEGIRNIGKKMLGLEIEKIYSSPIRRAVQTAEIIDGFLDVGVEVEENLKEMRLEPWKGLSEEEVAERFPEEWKVWNTEPSKLNVDGRETLKEVQLRALEAVKRIYGCLDYSKVLAVTHVALIRLLMIYYNEMNMDDYRKIDVKNGAVFLLRNNKITRVNI